MSEHTPGPWETNGTWVSEENDPGHNVGICICEPRPEIQANAHLIAAAPDLLMAAKSARALLMAYHGEFASDDYDPTWLKLDSAISKASGPSS